MYYNTLTKACVCVCIVYLVYVESDEQWIFPIQPFCTSQHFTRFTLRAVQLKIVLKIMCMKGKGTKCNTYINIYTHEKTYKYKY